MHTAHLPLYRAPSVGAQGGQFAPALPSVPVYYMLRVSLTMAANLVFSHTERTLRVFSYYSKGGRIMAMVTG